MAITEPTVNNAIAKFLSRTKSQWRTSDVIKSENTEIFRDNAKRPDIIIAEANNPPVIIETEFFPASTVEKDAISRLGECIQTTGRPILSSVAIVIPQVFKQYNAQELDRKILESKEFGISVFTGESKEKYIRYPKEGWFKGTALDISILTQAASVPVTIINEAANKLVMGVNESASLLNDIAKEHPEAIKIICEKLKQHKETQTLKMAMAILANALVFHESLARGPEELSEILSLDELRRPNGKLLKNALLKEWNKILKVNYWPIFNIAKEILMVIPTETSNLCDKLSVITDYLVANKLTHSHDLTGIVFQKLISDRKFLAAFYTTPSAAALLAGLAIDSNVTPNGKDWKNTDAVTSLRIADFACGTGTLVSTIYRKIIQSYEASGGNAESIHSLMMSNVFVGCDVLPSATHLTASMLACFYPRTKYSKSLIITVPFGMQKDACEYALGSLDLLSNVGVLEGFEIKSKVLEGMGEQEKELYTALPEHFFDLIIMNPPFTRNTGHEAKKVGVPNPMFAAFGTKKEEQRAMAKKNKKLLENTVYTGNAGEGSAFLALADKKLKQDGTLALVLPVSLITGDAWEKPRKLLREYYEKLIFVSISGLTDKKLSFSADTDMGECLIIGKKKSAEDKRALFVFLNEGPKSTMAGACVARQIDLIKKQTISKLEDGPFGGTPIYLGGDSIGTIIDAPLPKQGSFKLARISDVSLAQVAYQLENNGRIWLPGTSENEAIKIPISVVSKIGKVGPYHMDIACDTPTGGIRGPFNKNPIQSHTTPTYPILWSHNAKIERVLYFEADNEGIIRQGGDEKENEDIRNKVNKIVATASHCHFNRDFRFNSQSTAMQFTSSLTIGGGAWPSIKLANENQEKALTLWGNSYLGLLLHWYNTNKEQAGRGSITISPLDFLSVLDVRKLSTKQIKEVLSIFDDFKTKPLLPFNEIVQDKNRRELNNRLAVNVLGLPIEMTSEEGPFMLLAKKMGNEPSINGNKKSKCKL